MMGMNHSLLLRTARGSGDMIPSDISDERDDREGRTCSRRNVERGKAAPEEPPTPDQFSSQHREGQVGNRLTLGCPSARSSASHN